GSWDYDYIRILASNGITIGKPNGTYDGTGYVTLTQLNTFIERSKNLK
ncbi:MAG: S-layer homology domain-containing protein, partial [Lysinibacillus sp.]